MKLGITETLGGYRATQSEVSECGIACLTFCSTSLDAEISLAEVRARISTPSNGLNLKQLIEAASELGLQCRRRAVKPASHRHLLFHTTFGVDASLHPHYLVAVGSGGG